MPSPGQAEAEAAALVGVTQQRRERETEPETEPETERRPPSAGTLISRTSDAPTDSDLISRYVSALEAGNSL